MPNRYPFIPPHLKPSRPAIRPATVMEVLDSGGIDEGYRYRVAAFGLSMEMFTQPGAKLLTVGSLVLPRIVRTAAELFLPMPMQAETLYIALNRSDDGSIDCYEYIGSGVPTLLWNLSIKAEWLAAGSLAWIHATQSLFLAVFNYDTSDKLIYEWSPGDAAPTLQHSYAGENDGDQPVDWAEYKGNVYIVHSGANENPGYVCRFDPTNVAATFETVLTITSSDENLGEGGFVVFDDRIYATTSENIYYSVSGDSASWSELTDLPDDHDCHTARGAVSDPVSGYGFVVTTGDVVDYDQRQVWRLEADGTLTNELDESSPDDFDAYAFSQIAIPYGDVNVEPLAIQWQIGVNAPLDIYRRNAGAWALEEQFAGPGEAAWVGANQAAVYFQGKLHLLIGLYVGAVAHQYLYRRESVGNWTQVQDWSGYDATGTYSYSAAMTLGKTSKLIQNI